MHKYLIIFLIPFFLSSCFEVLEEVKLNSDGSGTFSYTVNFSQSATKIKSLMQMEEVEGYKVPSIKKINGKIAEICRLTKKVAGITQASCNTDFKFFIFEYNCNFNHIKALNAAADSIQYAFKTKDKKKKKYFAYSFADKTFERRGDDELLKAYTKMTESQKSIFIGANYTCLYRFETNIDTTSNNNVKIAVNRKAAFYQIDMFSVMTKPNVLEQRIQLK